VLTVELPLPEARPEVELCGLPPYGRCSVRLWTDTGWLLAGLTKQCAGLWLTEK
jgi:hypothetical protein